MPFRRAWRRIVATLVLLALSGMAWAAAQSAPPPAVLGDDTAALSLTPYLSYYHDASAVDDPDDPHPYWLVSTRAPGELAAAIEASRPVSA